MGKTKANVPATREQTAGGTALAVIDGSRFAALAPNSEQRQALAANLAPGERLDEQDLIRVPIPAGGATYWSVPDVTGDYQDDALEGILVYVGYRRILWPSEEPSGNPPVCVSDDLLMGRVRGELPEELAKPWHDGEGLCEKCPFNSFGTSKSGRGKRCKEIRLLFVLRENDAMPIVVNCAPGSLRDLRRFIKRLPVPHWRAVVRFGLESLKNGGGQLYSRIVPTLVGKLDEKTGAEIKRSYTDAIAKVVHTVPVDQGDIDGEAPDTEAN